MTDPNIINIGYFGKVPTRSDFIKVTDNANLTNIVDSWLTKSMELLSDDPRWKYIYDNISPMHFVVTATRIPRAVAGHLVASQDQAQRRFPFISLGTLQISQPTSFLLFCPLMLRPLWQGLEAQTHLVLQPEATGSTLLQLCTDNQPLELDHKSYRENFEAFLEDHSLLNLKSILAKGGYNGNLRQLILALGLLLHPVMVRGVSRLDKCLVLPLPKDLGQSQFIAAFWMHIVSPFLLNADFELVLILTKVKNKRVLVIGFDGASPYTLHAVMNPKAGAGHMVDFEDTEWVEEAINIDSRFGQFSCYLDQPSLLLHSVLVHFNEVFLG